ncbi:MAG TPA: sensor histidine kinase [Acidimicrobiales bacterium]|jgi:signal transduction histidine kinase|nr:sensor histidine kinase [Acidimicrobiales bacterium]
MADCATRRLALDLALAVVYTVVSIVVTRGIAEADDAPFDLLAHVLVVAIGATLALRRRWPLGSLAASTVFLVVYTLRDYPGGPVYLALLIVIYTLASSRGWRPVIVPVLLSLGALLAASVVSYDSKVFWIHVGFVGWTAAAIFLGDAALNRRNYLAGLEQRARDLEESREEEARRRVAEERLRIARDLHDVIAHGITTIHMQSGVAAHVLDRHPEAAGPALRAIKDVSKQTLAELRATLHLLREGNESAPLAPTPGLDRLEALVETTRRAGVPVDVTVQGERSVLPPAVDVTAYRIVQESLTNVMRHASAAHAEVAVIHAPDHVEIEITDDGRGASAAPTPGHGITGMRERAEMVGGHLEAGPRPGGGFRVQATLPLVGSAP